MKRSLAALAITAGLAAAGCGSSGTQVASSPCPAWKAQAQAQAANFVSNMPAASQQYESQMAQAAYQASAASHGIVCP